MTYKPNTVFITGATGGFGQAFAQKFADAGCKLVLHGRNKEKLAALEDSLKASVHAVVFDINDPQAVEDGIKSIPSEFANIDLLINNAGGALGLSKIYESDQADLDAMIDMNIRSLVQITRLVLPGMTARKRGHVINLGSIAGSWPYPGGHVYCGVKAFVHQFSLAMRSDLQGTNVRVTCVEPGLAETGFSLQRFKGDETKAKAVYANTTPLTPADIAENVFWVATQPPHVNVNTIEIMPTVQSLAPYAIERFS